MSIPGNQPPPGGPDVHIHTATSGHSTTYVVGQGSITIGQATGGRVGVEVDVMLGADVAVPQVFVGRDTQVEQLLGLIDPSGSGPTTAVVTAVAGLAGVGKTALARHVAQVAVGRGWFPGGAVWVDLRGYDPDPAGRVVPGQVFSGLVRALGVPDEQASAMVDERAAYRQVLARLAEHNAPVLLVLDNASTLDQLTGLLPAHRAHRVLVTSRHTLSIDGARILDLDVLDEQAAVDLLDQALRERHPDDRRAVEQEHDARDLARVCAGLPLALRIVAGLAADIAARPLNRLAAELADAHTRLDTLVHGERAVAAAFDLSWQHLLQRDPAVSRLFRLLPVNPGPDLSVEAAAALADELPHQTVQRLRVLRWAHLVETDPVGDRWRMHDLIRTYAASLPEDTPGELAGAIGRLLYYYLATAEVANRHLRARHEPSALNRFGSQPEALAWFDAERQNLLATVERTTAVGDHDTTAHLALMLAPFLEWRRYLTDLVTIATTARDAAQHLTERHTRGAAWSTLGLAMGNVRRFDEAVTAHQHALDIFQQAGDRHREGQAWGNLGTALRQVRRFDEAITAHRHALDIHREVGDRHGEGKVSNNLGLALAEVGQFDEAITAHQHALDLYRKTTDRRGEGTAWNNLGLALAEVGQFDEAITAHQHALEICHQIGDQHGEGTAGNNLGLALRQVRRFEEAITAHRTALDIHREVGDRQGEGTAWNNLGLALRQVGRFEEAITAHRHALDIYREVGDRQGEGAAWNNLGAVRQEVRRFEEAITAHQHALDIFQQTGNRHSEGMEWNNLGIALEQLGRFDEAITAHRTALDIHREVRDRQGEGTAWNNLGLALAGARRVDDAISALRQAIAAFTETGATKHADQARRVIQAITGQPRRTSLAKGLSPDP